MSQEYNQKSTNTVYLLRLYIYGRLYHYSIQNRCINVQSETPGPRQWCTGCGILLTLPYLACQA